MARSLVADQTCIADPRDSSFHGGYCSKLAAARGVEKAVSEARRSSTKNATSARVGLDEGQDEGRDGSDRISVF